jgi:hypothetical protein
MININTDTDIKELMGNLVGSILYTSIGLIGLRVAAVTGRMT